MSKSILHLWPPHWDPLSLAAFLVVGQDAELIESTNPDSAPAGQLPYLTVGPNTYSSLPAIIAHVHNASHIEPKLKAQIHAWLSHVQAHLGDLVLYMFYSLNWYQYAQPGLASLLPVPMRYYLPGRIRESYRPRLEASGLWNAPGAEAEKPKPFEKPVPEDHKSNFARVFEREKVLDKARSVLDMYSRLLGTDTHFFGQRSALDAVFAAYIVSLVDTPYPDPLLRSVIQESYPTLVAHARRIYVPPPATLNKTPSSLTSLLPPWPFKRGVKKEAKPEDIWFDRIRYGWISLAVGGLVWALVRGQIITIQFAPREDEEGGNDEDEDEMEEEIDDDEE